jgi:hypothetical protein
VGLAIRRLPSQGKRGDVPARSPDAPPRIGTIAAPRTSFIDLDQTKKDKRLDYLMIFRHPLREAGIVRCN